MPDLIPTALTSDLHAPMSDRSSNQVGVANPTLPESIDDRRSALRSGDLATLTSSGGQSAVTTATSTENVRLLYKQK